MVKEWKRTIVCTGNASKQTNKILGRTPCKEKMSISAHDVFAYAYYQTINGQKTKTYQFYAFCPVCKCKTFLDEKLLPEPIKQNSINKLNASIQLER